MTSLKNVANITFYYNPTCEECDQSCKQYNQKLNENECKLYQVRNVITDEKSSK